MKKQSGTQVNILTSAQINKQKWDDCVRNDTKALIYSYSWYLDKMTACWYGIVVNDYEAVLALPVKKMAGFRHIFTPPFFQRLDIAGTCDEASRSAIQQQVLAFSKVINLNNADPHFLNVRPKQKTDYVLRLDKPYPEIADHYTKECKKNIAKAVNRGCVLQQGISIQEVVSFYRKAYGGKAAYKEEHFLQLITFMEACEVQEYIHLMGVQDKNSGSLIFAAALLDDGKRIYYLLGAPSEEGRKARATPFFIDQVIAQFAGKRKVFDFEGSDIPDVASFYRSFAPQTEHYYRFYVNKFPQPIKALLDRFLK